MPLSIIISTRKRDFLALTASFLTLLKNLSGLPARQISLSLGGFLPSGIPIDLIIGDVSKSFGSVLKYVVRSTVFILVSL